MSRDDFLSRCMPLHEERESDILIEAEHASGAVSKSRSCRQAGVVGIGSQNLELFSGI
jgi:hypothetical protein